MKHLQNGWQFLQILLRILKHDKRSLIVVCSWHNTYEILFIGHLISITQRSSPKLEILLYEPKLSIR